MAMYLVASLKVQNAIFLANGLIEPRRFPRRVSVVFTCVLPGNGGDGPTLEIFSYDDMPDKQLPMPNDPSFAHIAFAVDDVEAALEAVISAGGSSVGEIATTEVGGVGFLQVIYARDPEGNIVELQKWR